MEDFFKAQLATVLAGSGKGGDLQAKYSEAFENLCGHIKKLNSNNMPNKSDWPMAAMVADLLAKRDAMIDALVERTRACEAKLVELTEEDEPEVKRSPGRPRKLETVGA